MKKSIMLKLVTRLAITTPLLLTLLIAIPKPSKVNILTSEFYKMYPDPLNVLGHLQNLRNTSGYPSGTDPLLAQGAADYAAAYQANTGTPFPLPAGYESEDIPTYGGGSTLGTSTSSTPTVNPAILAAYDQAINNTQAGINRLPTQLNSGFSGIDASYQNALNQLLASRNQGEQAYNTTKQQTQTDYVGAKNTIGSQAGSLLSGLRRLLGSRGAGGGSAYTQAVPQAVARGASIQRADVGNTFGGNMQALDTNWNNYLTGYNNQVSSAGNQREQQRQQLSSSIDTNRASLLQSLAQLQAQRAEAAGGNAVSAAQPYLDQANALLDKTANYTVAPINYQTQAYQAPDLNKYTFNPTTPTYQGQAQTTDYVSPYLAALLGKRQQMA